MRRGGCAACDRSRIANDCCALHTGTVAEHYIEHAERILDVGVGRLPVAVMGRSDLVDLFFYLITFLSSALRRRLKFQQHGLLQ